MTLGGAFRALDVATKRTVCAAESKATTVPPVHALSAKCSGLGRAAAITRAPCDCASFFANISAVSTVAPQQTTPALDAGTVTPLGTARPSLLNWKPVS